MSLKAAASARWGGVLRRAVAWGIPAGRFSPSRSATRHLFTEARAVVRRGNRCRSAGRCSSSSICGLSGARAPFSLVRSSSAISNWTPPASARFSCASRPRGSAIRLFPLSTAPWQVPRRCSRCATDPRPIRVDALGGKLAVEPAFDVGGTEVHTRATIIGRDLTVFESPANSPKEGITP